ncbi:hypothetical protein K440DRAFT_628379 [Wilcoxina mikolae CBS 423.85]|nr:hypothetical protein K440DRAFT_628379 [Wilcoxina mikolae CBS 423.85]
MPKSTCMIAIAAIAAIEDVCAKAKEEIAALSKLAEAELLPESRMSGLDLQSTMALTLVGGKVLGPMDDESEDMDLAGGVIRPKQKQKQKSRVHAKRPLISHDEAKAQKKAPATQSSQYHPSSHSVLPTVAEGDVYKAAPIKASKSQAKRHATAACEPEFEASSPTLLPISMFASPEKPVFSVLIPTLSSTVNGGKKRKQADVTLGVSPSKRSKVSASIASEEAEAQCPAASIAGEVQGKTPGVLQTTPQLSTGSLSQTIHEGNDHHSSGLVDLVMLSQKDTAEADKTSPVLRLSFDDLCAFCNCKIKQTYLATENREERRVLKNMGKRLTYQRY